MAEAKVKPSDFIAWALGLPLCLTMLSASTVISEPASRPAYCTPDMALMYDAIEHFWSGYDLAKPNPSVAPVKQVVVDWLVSEADKRGIADFSRTRAEYMDTIIRCPKARRGGNTL